MINNRQAGRRRGRGGNGNGSSNGQRQGGNPGRPDSGNRIDSRARGNANQLYEKYKNLARDAQMQGDRVNTEYYLQFADHYFRVLNETRSRFDDGQQRRGREDGYVNGFDNDFDGFDGDAEFGDEGEPARAAEQAGEPQRREARDGQGDRGQSDRGQSDRGQSDRGQSDRGQGDGSPGDRGQAERAQGERLQGERGQRNRVQRDQVPRDQVQREEPQRRERGDDGRRAVQSADRAEPVQADDEAMGRDMPAPVLAPVPQFANDLDTGEAPAAEPRRRGRPRRERPVEDAAPAAIEADRLPPSLSAGTASEEPAEASAEEPKPRRRRLRTAQGGEVTPAS